MTISFFSTDGERNKKILLLHFFLFDVQANALSSADSYITYSEQVK